MLITPRGYGNYTEIHAGCDPLETLNKGVNTLEDNGGWISFKAYPDAEEYFENNSGDDDIWQPCKVCDPGNYYQNKKKQ